MLHDHVHYKNATVKEPKQARAAAGFPPAYVTILITTFVVKLNGKTVLCDAGGGDQVKAFNPNSGFVSGKLIANMTAAAIDTKQGETILLSHFHPAHISILLPHQHTPPSFPHPK